MILLLTFDDWTHALRLGIHGGPSLRQLGLDGAPGQGAGGRGTDGVVPVAINWSGGGGRGSVGGGDGEGREEEKGDDDCGKTRHSYSPKF